MKQLDLFDEYARPVALALGFFDCLHIGHERLFDKAKAYAAELGAFSGALTFRTDPSTLLGGVGQIYDFPRRCHAFEELGADILISADFNAICSLTAADFLRNLFANFNIRALVVGGDYTFGCQRTGDVGMLENFCRNRGISLSVLPFLEVGGKKLSTCDLKDLVAKGNVETLNKSLTQPYFMLGEVVEGRKVGRSIGFATANIAMPTESLALGDGIYATRVTLDGRVYDAMTNVGSKPTFGDATPTVETHIFDFDRTLYGEHIKVSFYKKTRDIIRFDSAEQLIAQLNSDKQYISEYLKSIK